MEGRNSGKAPVREGEVLDLQIETIGTKGDGMAKIEGFVIFTPKTEQGRDYKVKITKVLARVAFAEVVEEL